MSRRRSTKTIEDIERATPQLSTGTSPQRPRSFEPVLSKAGALLLQAIALAVPMSYAAGRLYTDAYWQELGLSSSLLDRTTPDFVYAGFIALVNALAHYVGLDPYSTLGKIISIAVISGVFLLIVLGLGRLLAPMLRHGASAVDRAIQRFRALAKNEIISRLLSALSVTTTLVFGLLVLFWFCLVLFLFVALATQEGRRAARRVEAEFTAQVDTKTGDSNRAVIRVASSNGSQALLLECSSRWCVVFQNGGFNAEPAAAVLRIEHPTANPAAAPIRQ